MIIIQIQDVFSCLNSKYLKRVLLALVFFCISVNIVGSANYLIKLRPVVRPWSYFRYRFEVYNDYNTICDYITSQNAKQVG